MRPQETPGTTVPDLARLVSFVDGNIGKLSVLGFLGMVPIGLAMLRDEQLAGGLGAIWYEILGIYINIWEQTLIWLPHQCLGALCNAAEFNIVK